MQKVGILGGGQLGRMLLQEAANYPVETYVMEMDPECPSAHLCHHFIPGNIRDFNDVYNFGKGLNAITIEIESVNVEALEKLEQDGVKVYPSPAALRIIKNKIRQKEFYIKHEIPTVEYNILQNKTELEESRSFLPAVQKLAEGGYDGRGVQVLKSVDDLHYGFDAPSILEKLVKVKKEISVIIGINETGQTAMFAPAEMIFDPALNLLNYQVCPAELQEKSLWRVEAIALKVVKGLQSPGLFAIELLIDHDDNVYVNETAPRVHNSGHHTIEANYSSQYDILWRILLGYPLGNTKILKHSALINLVGEKGYSGDVLYEGLPEVLAIENTYLHLYGKKQTKPGRKMGHVTVIGDNSSELLRKVHIIKNTIKAVS
ncbi:MAG TPA: 5-(carboxyamino)imidazole ribonucleotide synthase [Chitinophagaceae bacterium]|jgi:5-(carboxyamino)imidazole ribonucleotide synthase|nr:5-(carboxyamino)imidazole ribonucleotide synthase [Chitinophagaceae bacterium]